MKKALFLSFIGIVLFASYAVAAQPQGQPFDAINSAIFAIQTQLANMQTSFASQIADLQDQINHIQLIPGPKGDKGDKGDPGTPSWNEARIASLESRVSALENQNASSCPVFNFPGTRLWDCFKPQQDQTEGTVIDVTGDSGVNLHFDWSSGTVTHTCQYAYTTYDVNKIQKSYSTFLYFADGGCNNETVSIPITSGVRFIRIDAWTPPSGIINASTEPEPESICSAIVCDDFNSYSKGLITGQGNWVDRDNGSSWVVQDTASAEGTKGLFNNFNNTVGNFSSASIIQKFGNALPEGQQSFYVMTKDKLNWGDQRTDNVQVGVYQDGNDGPARAVISFRKDDTVTYIDETTGQRVVFATYGDNTWNRLDIQWRSSDNTVRYRVDERDWTDWVPFHGSSNFTGFNSVVLTTWWLGTGGVYVDDLH